MHFRVPASVPFHSSHFRTIDSLSNGLGGKKASCNYNGKQNFINSWVVGKIVKS